MLICKIEIKPVRDLSFPMVPLHEIAGEDADLVEAIFEILED